MGMSLKEYCKKNPNYRPKGESKTHWKARTSKKSSNNSHKHSSGRSSNKSSSGGMGIAPSKIPKKKSFSPWNSNVKKNNYSIPSNKSSKSSNTSSSSKSSTPIQKKKSFSPWNSNVKKNNYSIPSNKSSKNSNNSNYNMPSGWKPTGTEVMTPVGGMTLIPKEQPNVKKDNYSIPSNKSSKSSNISNSSKGFSSPKTYKVSRVSSHTSRSSHRRKSSYRNRSSNKKSNIILNQRPTGTEVMTPVGGMTLIPKEQPNVKKNNYSIPSNKSSKADTYSIEKIITTKNPKTKQEIEIPIAKTKKGTYVYKLPSGEIVETSDPNSGKIAQSYQTSVLGHAPKFATSYGTVKSDQYGNYKLKKDIALAKKGKATLYLTKDNQIVNAGGLSVTAAKQRGLSKLDPKTVVYEKGEIYIAPTVTKSKTATTPKTTTPKITEMKGAGYTSIAEVGIGKSNNLGQSTSTKMHPNSTNLTNSTFNSSGSSITKQQENAKKIKESERQMRIAHGKAIFKQYSPVEKTAISISQMMSPEGLGIVGRRIVNKEKSDELFYESLSKKVTKTKKEVKEGKNPIVIAAERTGEDLTSVGSPLGAFAMTVPVGAAFKAASATKIGGAVMTSTGGKVAMGGLMAYWGYSVADEIQTHYNQKEIEKIPEVILRTGLQLGGASVGAGLIGTKVKTPSGKTQYTIKGGQTRKQINIAKRVHKGNEFTVNQKVTEQYPNIIDNAMNPLNKVSYVKIKKVAFPTKHPRTNEYFAFEKLTGGKPSYTSLDIGKSLKLKGAHLTGLDNTGNKIVFKKGTRLYNLESSGKPFPGKFDSTYKNRLNFRVTTKINGKIKVISKGTTTTKKMNAIKKAAIEKHTTSGYEHNLFGELVQTTFPKTPIKLKPMKIYTFKSKETMTKELNKVLFKPLDRVSKISNIHKNVVTVKGKEMLPKYENLDIGKSLKLKGAHLTGLDNTGNKIVFKKGTRLYYLEGSTVKGNNIYYKATTKVNGKIKVISRGKMPLDNYRIAGRKAMRLQYEPSLPEPRTTTIKPKIVKIDDLIKPAKTEPKTIKTHTTQQLIRTKNIKPATKQISKIKTKTQKLKFLKKKVFRNPPSTSKLVPKVIAINTANVKRIIGDFSAMTLLNMQPHRKKIKRIAPIIPNILQGKGKSKEKTRIRTQKLTPNLISIIPVHRDIIQKQYNNDLLKLITKPNPIQPTPKIRTTPTSKKLPQQKRSKRIAPVLPIIPNMFPGKGGAGGIDTILKEAEHKMAKIEQLL